MNMMTRGKKFAHLLGISAFFCWWSRGLVHHGSPYLHNFLFCGKLELVMLYEEYIRTLHTAEVDEFLNLLHEEYHMVSHS